MKRDPKVELEMVEDEYRLLEDEILKKNEEMVALHRRKRELKKILVEEEKKKNGEFLEMLSKNEHIILPLLHHARTSCSDDHVANGIHTEEENGKMVYRYRCPKCAVIEILRGDWGKGLKIKLGAEIEPIED